MSVLDAIELGELTLTVDDLRGEDAYVTFCYGDKEVLSAAGVRATALVPVRVWESAQEAYRQMQDALSGELAHVYEGGRFVGTFRRGGVVPAPGESLIPKGQLRNEEGE